MHPSVDPSGHPLLDFVSKAGVIAIYSFLQLLLPRIGIPNPHHFIANLVNSRYDPLTPSPMVKLDAASRTALVAAIDQDLQLNQSSYSQHVKHLVEAFDILEGRPGGDSVREVVLAHLVELWVVRLLGPTAVAKVLGCFVQCE